MPNGSNRPSFSNPNWRHADDDRRAAMTDLREETMIVRCKPVGAWAMNAHVLVCSQTGQSVLIDPGAEPQTLTKLLDNSTPVAILITHNHPDHVGALEAMRRQLGVPVMAPALSGIGADRQLNTNDRIDIGEQQIRVYSTPGHTEDQVSFGVEGHPIYIVGDTIFEGGPGKTWSCADFQTTLATMRNIVLAWPDDALCYPGHGDPFPLGPLRPAIERFLAKDHGPFFGDAEWEM